MTDQIVEEKVRSIIAEVARIEPTFSPDADVFRELGVDSAAALDLLLRLEEEFDLAIADEAFAEARSLTKMSRLISDMRDQRS